MQERERQREERRGAQSHPLGACPGAAHGMVCKKVSLGKGSKSKGTQEGQATGIARGTKKKIERKTKVRSTGGGSGLVGP